VTFHQLLQRYGSAASALAALPELARRGGRRDFKAYSRSAAERELAAIAQFGARLIGWSEAEYPPLLAELDDAPPLLTLFGHPHLLAKPMVGVVGARNASAAGQRFTREIAGELGEAGFVVVSGLARGIDTAAHQGSLVNGAVAVVAGGADIVYPEENRALHEAIARQGAIIAESPLGLVPQARHFPRRNRVISGMSAGVLVVEAALRSGSLITARLAGEQGREVFAVPGSPLDPRCRGTNDLIRNGAVLTESAADILAVLRQTNAALREGRRRPHTASTPLEIAETQLEEARRRLASLLSPTPVTVDELVRQCHFSPAIVAAVLLELELAGRLDRHPGHQVSLR
jgi:DNA processing protein